MKNYADMSDHEINTAVASAIGVDFEVHESGVYTSIKWWGDNVVSVAGVVDYCNNWADAGPVIEKNRISIEFDLDDQNTATAFNKHYPGWYEKNPLRAAMIVFLMMKDNETRILAPDEVSDERVD